MSTDFLSPQQQVDFNATSSSINSDPDDHDHDGDGGSSSDQNASSSSSGAVVNSSGGNDEVNEGGGAGDEESLVKSTDMGDLMQQHAVTFAIDAIKQGEEEGNNQCRTQTTIDSVIPLFQLILLYHSSLSSLQLNKNHSSNNSLPLLVFAFLSLGSIVFFYPPFSFRSNWFTSQCRCSTSEEGIRCDLRTSMALYCREKFR